MIKFCQQELCRQARIEYAEETRRAQELHDKIKAEVAEAKYNKHYNICWEVSAFHQPSQPMTRVVDEVKRNSRFFQTSRLFEAMLCLFPKQLRGIYPRLV